MAKVTRITLENTGGLDKRRLHLREISLTGDTPLESIGQDLRHARERKGEDLAQISRVLKIRKDLLEAIEESNMEALPARAYVIGFVRSYADYLGLDANNAVERLKAEIAGRGDGKDSPTTAAPAAERKSVLSGTWIFGGLLILVLVYSVYYLIVSAGRMTSQPVIPVPERLAEQAGITAQSSPPAEQPAPPASDPAASVTVRALPAPAAPVPVAVTPAPAPAAVAPPLPLPAGLKYGAQNAGSRITLRVHRPTLVNVLGRDDRLFMNRHLNPGDTYLVPNVVGLRLNTPDAGAVEVILDGSSVGFVGQDGADAADVSLNPNDVADRQRRG